MSSFVERRMRQLEPIGARMMVRLPGLSPVWVSTVQFVGDTWTRVESGGHITHFEGYLSIEDAARLYHAPRAVPRIRFVDLVEWKTIHFPDSLFIYADVLIIKAGHDATVEHGTFLPEYESWVIRKETLG